MAHKFHTGAFLREAAWHGLGHVIDQPLPTIEMFKLANADYTADRRKIFLQDGTEIPGFNAIVRNDTSEVLSVMPDTYHVIPNDRLIELADALRENIELNAVTVLDGGRKTTFSGRILSLDKNIKGDDINMHLSGVNSFDGSTAFTILMSAIRIVCQNTAGWAMQDAEAAANRGKNRMLRITHRAGAAEMIKQIPNVINFATLQFDKTIEQIEAMVNTPCDTALFKQFLELTFAEDLKRPINDVRGDDNTKRQRRLTDIPGIDDICNIFAGDFIGETPAVAGNMWRAFNSITQFYRHSAFEGGKNAEERRYGSLQFGINQQRIQRARAAALQLTKA